MKWCHVLGGGLAVAVTSSRKTARAFIAVMLGCIAAALVTQLAFAWEYWGGDRGGTRFSPLRQITPANVDRLVRAWDFRTGDLARRDPKDMAWTKFEGTPLFVESSLIFCTPFNEVIAVDPGNGAQKWRFDPKIRIERPANRYNCRGVAYWVDEQAPPGAACRSRIFMGTNDMRVIALDATTGATCSRFGVGGDVKVDAGMPLEWPGEMSINSAPVVARGTVVVGSSIADNVRVRAPRGTVWGLDARTGSVRWTWDPLVHDGIEAGHANVWAPMSSDEEMGLVFLPTSSPSPDFWGGKRPGNNEHADSVVALRAETGELAWAFQTVHHDVWDYDLAAQPTVARIDTDRGARDVVIQPTKQGFLFVLDKATGQPVWPVEERPAPQGAVEGEQLSPTQPFPTHVPALVPQRLSAEDAFGLMWNRTACREELARSRNDGLYTPPSIAGSLTFPMAGGGVNWGGVAFDPVNQILYANTSRAAHIVTLIPRAEAGSVRSLQHHDFGPQRGAPFAMTRVVALSPLSIPCNPPPWGVLTAVDLRAGKILWGSTVGTTEDLAPLGIAFPWGTPLVNGVLVTGGGLIFTGAEDAYLRAFDAKSGAELWQGRLPVPGVANPMTYLWNGEQYVVISAGGHSEAGTSIGDSVVAFRLARAGETPSLWSRTVDRPGGRFYYSVASLAAMTLLLFVVWTLLRRTRRETLGTSDIRMTS